MAKKPETFGPKTALKLSGVCAWKSLSCTQRVMRLPINRRLNIEYNNSLVAYELINNTRHVELHIKFAIHAPN